MARVHGIGQKAVQSRCTQMRAQVSPRRKEQGDEQAGDAQQGPASERVAETQESSSSNLRTSGREVVVANARATAVALEDGLCVRSKLSSLSIHKYGEENSVHCLKGKKSRHGTVLGCFAAHLLEGIPLLRSWHRAACWGHSATHTVNPQPQHDERA
eukprot:3934252-Pleurochrysis_carterae.AAC.5